MSSSDRPIQSAQSGREPGVTPSGDPIAEVDRATCELAQFASALRLVELSDSLLEQLGWVIADTIASIVAGSAEPELKAMAARLAGAPGPALLAGFGRATSADAAALVNGSAGTFLEMDEGNRFSRGHPAVHVLPAALALSEERSLDAESFLCGVLAGYEIGSRIGRAARLRGSMHPHGTWGTVGAAAACARAAGLEPGGFVEVINVSSSLTIASSKRTMLEGGLVRNVYAGLSNRHGLLALSLVDCGFTGERHGIASVFGSVVSDGLDESMLLEGLGSQWHLQQNYFKLHSCCRYNHGTLDAIDQLAMQAPLPEPDAIASIEVSTYNLAAELEDPAPRNTLAAKFSVPFAVASRIVNGSSGLQSFTWEAIRNPAIGRLAARVQVREDQAMTRRLPQERPARVTIRLTDGSVRSAEVGVNRGDDALPYGRDELTEKFIALCGRVWPRAHCEHLLESTLGLAAQAIAGRGRPAFDAWRALLASAPQTDTERTGIR